MFKISRFLIMLIIVPLDYIGWNLIFGHTHGKITLKEVITDNWKEILGAKIHNRKSIQ